MSNKVDVANQRGPACLSEDTLVSYLYDESSPEERQRVEQHAASCMACATELETLSGTRVQLASWTPPEAALGFSISPAAAAPATTVVPFVAPSSTVRAPWWRQPMPVWGQAVAATVLFGLGMAAGNRQLPVAPATTESGTPVSASQLASFESQLRREIAAMRPATAAPAAPVAARARLDEAEHEALMRQVRQLVRESEDRQQQAFTIRAAQVARDAEIQRRLDVATLRQSLEQMQGSTSEVQRQNAELYRILSTTAGLRR